jgi:TonB family protein
MEVEKEGGPVRNILIVSALSAIVGGAALAQTETVYQPGEGVTVPSLIKEVKPTYTEAAMRRRAQGTVVTSCVVLADGTVGDVTVTTSLDSDLDQSAIAAVKQWRFKPGTKDGKPVPVQVSVELAFTLRDSPPHRMGDEGVSAPVLVKEMKPDYPAAAKRQGVEGTVELEGVVQTDGSINDIRVTKSVDARLDQAAVTALGQWRFRPGQKDGAPVRVLILVELSFKVK